MTYVPLECRHLAKKVVAVHVDAGLVGIGSVSAPELDAVAIVDGGGLYETSNYFFVVPHRF